MKHILGKGTALVVAAVVIALALASKEAGADPSKYPQYAQHQLPKGLVPEFVYLNQLTDEVTAGRKPLIVDVRTVEEYREAHILDQSPSRWMIYPSV